MARTIQSDEKQRPTTKITLPSKGIRIEAQIKSFPDKKILKEVIITKPLLHEMLRGFIFKKTKTMNNQMAINTYLSIIESKQTANTQNKQAWIQLAF